MAKQTKTELENNAEKYQVYFFVIFYIKLLTIIIL